MWNCGYCCTDRRTEVEFETLDKRTASIGFRDTDTASIVSPELNRGNTLHNQYKELVDNESQMSTAQSLPILTAVHQDVPEDKDSQKETLRRLVKEFARESVKGVEVELVEKQLSQKSKCLFIMNPLLTTISISSLDIDAIDIHFNVNEMVSVCKSPEIETVHKWLSGSSVPTTSLVAISYKSKVSNETQDLIFTFSDSDKQFKFYASLRILCMAAGMENNGKS